MFFVEKASFVAYETLAIPMDKDPDLEQPLLAHDPDTMYLHEAMKQPDKKKFLEAMRQEVAAQTANGN
jgi:hypothetical protein